MFYPYLAVAIVLLVALRGFKLIQVSWWTLIISLAMIVAMDDIYIKNKNALSELQIEDQISDQISKKLSEIEDIDSRLDEMKDTIINSEGYIQGNMSDIDDVKYQLDELEYQMQNR